MKKMASPGNTGNKRRRQPMTKKEIYREMGICLAVLALATIYGMIFPSEDEKKAQPSPSPTISAEATPEATPQTTP